MFVYTHLNGASPRQPGCVYEQKRCAKCLRMFEFLSLRLYNPAPISASILMQVGGPTASFFLT